MGATFNLPNMLTAIRIALIPLLVMVFYLPPEWSNPTAAFVFAAAGLTDWLDGYLARKLGQTSAFGAFLDPVADKLMVAVALVLLVQANPGAYVTIPAAIIIGREITVSALREWMAQVGAGHRVTVSIFGKFKTLAQFFGISFMLYKLDILGLPIYKMGWVLLMISAGLTLWSMVLYLRAAWPSMRDQ
ncbi:MAG: CDP-diacylglycerol--glycerol-3-phosphate 3-phosphatidyltransferase [Gammaproteobacteria bacterium]